MKRLVVLAGCCVFLLVAAGCKDTGKQDRGSEETVVAPAPPRGAVEVVVEGGGQFPAFLVGEWKADKHDWVIKFEPNGRISSLVHYIWAMPINLNNEGGYYIEDPNGDNYAIFLLGPCEADYNPTTRQLNVEIIIDMYEIKVAGDSLGGGVQDFFTGPISEDEKIWTASWRHLELERVEGADSAESDFPVVQLVFTKVDIK